MLQVDQENEKKEGRKEALREGEEEEGDRNMNGEVRVWGEQME